MVDAGCAVTLLPLAMRAAGGPAVGVVHRLIRGDGPVQLELEALCTWRDAHGNRSNQPNHDQDVAGGLALERGLLVLARLFGVACHVTGPQNRPKAR